jgi:hypothetical protein
MVVYDTLEFMHRPANVTVVTDADSARFREMLAAAVAR